MLVIEAMDKCDELRADLAEAFAQATGAERLAISEALEHVGAARRALQRDGLDSDRPRPVAAPPEINDAPSVTEEPPPPGASISAVDTTYATPFDGTPPLAGDASIGASVDRSARTE